ncbi:unnamed protein product [Owenia fusiformis]|uniref:Uncharacterized protein n=1 Tax=Owenia fusiformis TaxID=6347 RepID=A0A8J1UC34_OWEFU|nr:unnamed protein product [Owenia fusiformis]
MLSYEDLIVDFQGCAKKIAKFLGQSYPIDFYQNLERACSIDKMRNNKALDPTIAHRTDKNSSMFRKGVIGDWQNHFTVEQNKKFDAIYKTRMKDCDIPIRFTMQPKYNAKL